MSAWRLFRDGYNRTNLTFGHGTSPAEVAFSAVDEPWDGPGVHLFVRVLTRFFRLEITWR